MEGMMLCAARPRPPPPWVIPPAPLALLRRETVPVLLLAAAAAAGEGRPRRHSSSCGCGAAAARVPSIWHAITPSPCSEALPVRRWRRCCSGEEGSWNAAWDARPARWLHGSDSAWMLFGVCSCFSLLDEGRESETIAVAEGAAGGGGALLGDSRKHFKVTGMLADGRCLFRSIVYGACLKTGKKAPDETEQKELADDLRTRVVDELLKRRDEIERFIEEDFDLYIERIRQPYIWGGEPELLMTSHVLQTPLAVFMMDRSSDRLINIAKYGQEYEKKDNAIKVLFHGYGHYDALEISTGER